MVDRIVPYPDPGQAAFEQLDNYSAGLLISGSFPPLSPGHPLPITANLALAQFTVVGLTAGKLVKATWNANAANGVKPIGVLTQPVVGNADGTTTVDIWYSGNFNPDMLVWDASFDTMDKKIHAFEGSPSPTQVLIRERG